MGFRGFLVLDESLLCGRVLVEVGGYYGFDEGIFFFVFWREMIKDLMFLGFFFIFVECILVLGRNVGSGRSVISD